MWAYADQARINDKQCSYLLGFLTLVSLFWCPPVYVTFPSSGWIWIVWLQLVSISMCLLFLFEGQLTSKFVLERKLLYALKQNNYN